MLRGVREDKNLAELKAVLKKLHHLDLPSDANQGSKDSYTLPNRSEFQGQSDLKIFDRKLAVIEANNPAEKRQAPSWMRLAAFGLVLGVAVVVVAIGQGVVPGVSLTMEKGLELHTTAGPALKANAQKSDSSLALSEARRLLNEGDVVKTRETLLAASSTQTPEIIFLLAQSYDPNYLRSIAKSNAEPDRVQAERWYRKWHELAQNAGLEMDNTRLKRIINAMQ